MFWTPGRALGASKIMAKNAMHYQVVWFSRPVGIVCQWGGRFKQSLDNLNGRFGTRDKRLTERESRCLISSLSALSFRFGIRRLISVTRFWRVIERKNS